MSQSQKTPEGDHGPLFPASEEETGETVHTVYYYWKTGWDPVCQAAGERAEASPGIYTAAASASVPSLAILSPSMH